MNRIFIYLFALCTLVHVYGCDEDFENLGSIEGSSPEKVHARSTQETFSCGTIASEPPAWYFNTASRSSDDNSIYTLNIFVHVIRSSSGIGLNKESVSRTIFDKLNDYYASAKINFFLLGSDYIDFDRYNNSTEDDSGEIFQQNSHTNAIDIYVLSDGANWEIAAGKADGIIGSACIIVGYNYTNFVVTHEVGHCLGLYHTHHGTSKDESGTPELVNGSNSATAGDFMTDTPADPCEWMGGMYVGTSTDANGDYYCPDPTNIMSYSWNYYQNYFSPEQIAKMRYIIRQSDKVKPTLHHKQIIGPKHFSESASYSLSVVNTDESVRWEVTAYSEGASVKTAYAGDILTLSSTKPTYYHIVAYITSPAGTKSLVTFATCNEPSPYIADLCWETNQGQYGVTNATSNGNILYVSDNLILNMEYIDKAGNTSNTLADFEFICITATNRQLRGKTFSLTPADCTQNLNIRAKDACGTSGKVFVIPCRVTNYYYDVNVASNEIAIDVVETGNKEINTILANRAVALNALAGGIKSVVISMENQQVVYSKDFQSGASGIKIDTGSWTSGTYNLSISNGSEVRHYKVVI